MKVKKRKRKREREREREREKECFASSGRGPFSAAETLTQKRLSQKRDEGAPTKRLPTSTVVMDYLLLVERPRIVVQ